VTATSCAMFVFGTVEFDRPLAEISPWLDMQANELAAVVVALETQEHRRLITYLCVGRDPRDAALSFEHHMANLDWDVFMAARSAAVGISDLEEPGPRPEPPTADPVERC